MSDLRSQISVWYVHEQGSRTQPADIDPPTILVGHLVTGRDDMIVGDVLYRTPSDDLRFSFPQIQGRLWGREERASKLLSVEVIMVRYPHICPLSTEYTDTDSVVSKTAEHSRRFRRPRNL